MLVEPSGHRFGVDVVVHPPAGGRHEQTVVTRTGGGTGRRGGDDEGDCGRGQREQRGHGQGDTTPSVRCRGGAIHGWASFRTMSLRRRHVRPTVWVVRERLW
jgi:hypothetical protein